MKTTQVCISCKKRKLVKSGFYVRTRKSGNLYVKKDCKKCFTNLQKSRYSADKEFRDNKKEYAKAHHTAYLSNMENLKKRNDRMRRYGKLKRVLRAKRDWNRRNYKANFFKTRARRAIINAVNSGKIIRPTHCVSCNEPKKVEAHHHLGYDKKNWLHIKWLCHLCHSWEHFQNSPSRLAYQAS